MLVGNLAEATRLRFRVLAEHSSVRAAAAVFSDTRLGLVVVCNAAGRASGVISKSDLVRHLAHGDGIDAPVAAMMTRSIVSGHPGDDLQATWTRMMERQLQNLPLLADDNRPVGTLDIRDALQAILRMEQNQEEQLINYIAGVGYR